MGGENKTSSGTYQKREVPIRDRSINYDPFKDFNEKSCNVFNIEMHDIDTSYVHPVKFTHEKGTRQYHGSELKEIITFEVVFMPLANTEGVKLIPVAKTLVEEVLKDTYEPKHTATIVQKGKDGKPISERNIAGCVVTAAKLEIDANDYFRIGFTLTGIASQAEGGES